MHLLLPQDESQNPITVFMGVPTMYSYLLSAYDDMSTSEQARARRAQTLAVPLGVSDPTVVGADHLAPGPSDGHYGLQECRGKAPIDRQRLSALPSQHHSAMGGDIR